VYVAPFDVRMAEERDVSHDEILNVVQPDVSVYCREEEQLDDAGVVAAPDIAVEVLSPYTSVKDQREKLKLYERFGVKEYWIIDPANETLSVYSKIEGNESYGKPAVYGREDTFKSAVLEDFKIDMGEMFEKAGKEMNK